MKKKLQTKTDIVKTDGLKNEEHLLKVKVAEELLKGKSQTIIAKTLNVSLGYINKVVGDMRKEWQITAQENMNEFIGVQLKQLQMIKREAWKQWERSVKDTVHVIESVVEMGDGSLRVNKTTKKMGSSGNPRFLEIVSNTVNKENELYNLLEVGADSLKDKSKSDDAVRDMYEKIVTERFLKDIEDAKKKVQGTNNVIEVTAEEVD